MKSFWIAAAALLAALATPLTAAQAQKAPLAIPGVPPAKDVPGAKELPDPNTVYKLVFMDGKAAATPDAINPTLLLVGEYVNTLAAYGVPADHRKIAIVIHQAALPMVLNDEAFKAKYGRPNPDLVAIKALKKAGVELYVCGQGVLADKIDPKTITPEVELTLWAMTTLTNLEMRGYAPAGG